MICRPRFLVRLCLLPLGVAVLLFSGCGEGSHGEHNHDHSEPGAHSEHTENKKSDGHGHDDDGHDGHGDEKSLTRFVEDRGLQLAPEVVVKMEIQSSRAEERTLTPVRSLTARIFSVSPTVQASAWIPAGQSETFSRASLLGENGSVSCRFVRVDRVAEKAAWFAELVFELDPDSSSPKSPAFSVGDFIEVQLEGNPVTTVSVPVSSVIEGAGGPFVYVLHDGHYRRVPVKTGVRTSEWVEVSEGVGHGDSVVISPVEQLWLTELRLTRGGGHSH